LYSLFIIEIQIKVNWLYKTKSLLPNKIKGFSLNLMPKKVGIAKKDLPPIPKLK